MNFGGVRNQYLLSAVLLILVCLGVLIPGARSEDKDMPQVMHENHMILPMDQNIVTGSEKDPDNKTIGIESKIGDKIPLDLVFAGETGRKLKLSDIIDKPTLVLPVFYHCPGICSLMLANLAKSLNRVPLTPGKDYRVMSISFDQTETPSMALNAKRNYLKILTIPFPESDWLFLTGDVTQITTTMDAMGFYFKKVGEHNFIHPNVLIVLAADGIIIRYLHGQDFLPFDIGMALTEATKGKPGISIRKLASYCFSYDPENKTYVLKTFKISAAGIIVVLIFFFLLFLRKGKHKDA